MSVSPTRLIKFSTRKKCVDLERSKKNFGKFIPTRKDLKTPELARLLIKHLYRLYGLLANIVFDRDRKFDSHFLRKVFKNLETTLSLRTTNYP